MLVLNGRHLPQPMWVVAGALFASAACRRIVGTLANDLADRADDRAASNGFRQWVLYALNRSLPNATQVHL
jgi:4-hydroxybenzoate polyprenyltransferase